MIIVLWNNGTIIKGKPLGNSGKITVIGSGLSSLIYFICVYHSATKKQEQTAYAKTSGKYPIVSCQYIAT